MVTHYCVVEPAEDITCYAYSTDEAFLQDFLDIMKKMLQN